MSSASRWRHSPKSGSVTRRSSALRVRGCRMLGLFSRATRSHVRRTTRCPCSGASAPRSWVFIPREMTRRSEAGSALAAWRQVDSRRVTQVSECPSIRTLLRAPAPLGRLGFVPPKESATPIMTWSGSTSVAVPGRSSHLHMALKVSRNVHDCHGDRTIHSLSEVCESSSHDARVSGTDRRCSSGQYSPTHTTPVCSSTGSKPTWRSSVTPGTTSGPSAESGCMADGGTNQGAPAAAGHRSPRTS